MKEAIDYANWLNNNWYIPTGTDGAWRINVEHVECGIEEPRINLFTTEELYNKFQKKEGEF